MNYQATLASPIGKLGIQTEKDKLIRIHFLDARAPITKPKTYIAKETILQLQCYFADPFYPFDLPFELKGTELQKKLWKSLLEIPVGQSLSYGEQADKLGTSARAVGNGCRVNPIPIVIPCHRIVGKDGLGGYAGETEGNKVHCKKWLLRHEARRARTKAKLTETKAPETLFA